MFKKYDFVKCIDDTGTHLIEEQIYQVSDIYKNGDIALSGKEGYFNPLRFIPYLGSNVVDGSKLTGNFLERKESVLDEANKIIYGDREKTYGKPSKNLDTIAKFWGEYLGIQLEAKDVAVMMILLKTARLRNDINHRDSIVDICGYAALIERCDE